MCDEMERWTRIDFKLWMIEAADHQCEALTWYRVERVSARALRVWLTLKEEERQVRSLLRRAKNDTTPIRPKGRRDAKAEMIRRRSLCIDTTSSFHLYTHAGTRVHVPSSRKLHLYVFLVLTQRLQQSRAEQSRAGGLNSQSWGGCQQLLQTIRFPCGIWIYVQPVGRRWWNSLV